MERNIDINSVSDGKLYDAGDMVKAGCGDCKGCHMCCTGMGNSIVLDPYDIYRIISGTKTSFNQLLNDNRIELNVVDGIILPNLKLSGSDESCSFLDNNGRCSIHPFRPGICRMFPLGRIYNDNGFKYFFQVNECPKPDKVKVKIKKWIDTPDLDNYEQYIGQWHKFLKNMEKIIAQLSDESAAHNISIMIMKYFYMTEYDDTDFYCQFYKRLDYIRERLGGI